MTKATLTIKFKRVKTHISEVVVVEVVVAISQVKAEPINIWPAISGQLCVLIEYY